MNIDLRLNCPAGAILTTLFKFGPRASIKISVCSELHFSEIIFGKPMFFVCPSRLNTAISRL